MDQPTDPAGAVLDALEDLRKVVNARDWCNNVGLRGESNEIRDSWGRLEQALEGAVDIVHAPKPGQGLASIWLTAITKCAARVEGALGRSHGGWADVLFHDNEYMLWLVHNGWERGCYILGFGRGRERPIAKLLEPRETPLVKLRGLAASWRHEYRTNSTNDAGWRRSREEYVQRAAKLLLEAVNLLEVAPDLMKNVQFRDNIILYIDKPSHLVWPLILDESSESLGDLADWLTGEPRPGINLAVAAADCEQQDDLPAGSNGDLPAGSPSAISPSGQLKLFAPDDLVELCGSPHPPLTVAQYDSLSALCCAGDKGMRKTELVKESGHQDAVNVIKRLRGKDSRWIAVIKLAGISGGRYRVL